jgi:NhaA family Na+:H+ antiporter
MATDIAFAVGVLTLLGPRVAPALRILLLALAVIDDVGAILVIALFYSTGIQAAGLWVVLAGIAAVLVMQWIGVRSPWAYVAPAIVVWAGAYAGGVHPTLAGVLVGLLTPVKAWYGLERFFAEVRQRLEATRSARNDHELLPHLDAMARARAEALAPVVRLQHALHGWVAFGIMPLFALANAGVPLGSASLSGDGLAVFAGVTVGLALGKLLGILSFSWLSVRLGLAALPRGVSWSGVAVVGLVGGIGFTMALFIAGLALPAGAMLETAKLAILCASLAAALVALAIGRFALPARAAAGARDEDEAERSAVL